MALAQSHSTRDWHRPLDLDYVAHGDPGAPPVLMLVGLGMQRFEWPEGLIKALSRTHRVICPDNRDAGRSPICGPSSEPAFRDVWVKRDKASARQLAPYLLEDMCSDVQRLVDRLSIDRFAIVGFSMGGMIAQMVAAALPERVTRFVQLASNDGTAEVDSDAESTRRMARMFTQPANKETLRSHLLSDALYFSAGRLQNTPELRAEIDRVIEQGYQFGGAARHAMAVLAAPERGHLLDRIKAKTLVLHGDSDPCIALARGKAAAKRIPGAELRVIPGTGHIIDEAMCKHTLNWLGANIT